jgi:Cu(I)/Ag(I) efflux system protein CusF
MKFATTASLILALSASSVAMAQSGSMKNMDMKDMDMKTNSSTKVAIHKATGVVKAVDQAKGTVTIAHGPVQSLNWPAMTMTFVVKDKMFFDKLAVARNVTIDFTQQDKDYVVTAVK